MVYGQGGEAGVCRKGENGQGEPGSKSMNVHKYGSTWKYLGEPGRKSMNVHKYGSTWENLGKPGSGGGLRVRR